MQTYANALLIAIPAFSVLVLIEALYGARTRRQTLNHMDTISSLSSGITNVIKDSLGLVIVIVSYPFITKHLALVSIEASWLVWVLAFLAIDFAGYWSHRLNHSINLFWNNHVIHHSSEEFNLACALRQSISNIVGYYALFLLPAALLGIPPQVINVLAPLHLFLQFWYHTRHIPKLGWLEYVIITPSQHRVHHAINPEYLDKNLGQIFPWWDRMFGTFQEELEAVEPIYGITRPARTWNPIRINFQHVWLLAKDAWRTRNWIDKLRIWFMPTGWRPPDVEERYPVFKIEDPYQFDKYTTPSEAGFIVWSWIQFTGTMLLLLYFLFGISEIGMPNALYYGAFLFAAVWGYTSLMDRLSGARWFEIARGVAGAGYVIWSGGWFGLEAYWSSAPAWVAIFWVGTALGGWAFGRETAPVPEAS